MDQILDEFYVTLPSNSSMKYFPENTQSSYRTKLSPPLVMHGDWEVALSEVFMPRSWFNVGHHNNSYSISILKEELIPADSMHYNIELPERVGENVEDFWRSVNEEIEKKINTGSKSVRFLPENNGSAVHIEISDGFGIIIKENVAPKLLYMLHLPEENTFITKSDTYRFRPSLQNLALHSFTIINKNPQSVTSHILPLTHIKREKTEKKNEDVFKILNANIELLELQNYLKFKYEPVKHEVEIMISETAELRLIKGKSNSLMEKLNLPLENIALKGIRKYEVNPLLPIQVGEHIELDIKEYYTTKKITSHTENLVINIGMYKTAEKLLKEFKYIKMKQQPDLKVRLDVPKNHEVCFSKGLSDMLGFSKNEPLKSGSYISDYALEIDGGITEIFIYTDIVVSHHVGDTLAPLLRVIPCIDEKDDQIVKHYDAPLYFPLRKNFIETIEIELKSSSGDNIIFSGGKTFVVLSFRRKKL